MILVFGGTTGGLGQPLYGALASEYPLQEVVAVGRVNCNVEYEDSISAFLKLLSPDGPLHIINATGASISSMIHKADISDINKMLRVNVTANILLLKHARELYKKLGGTFTMFGSYAAGDGPAGSAVYAASKAALSGLTRVAAVEFGSLNTRVNCIDLGFLNVGMIEQVRNIEGLVMTIPVGRLGYPKDVAEACKFLIECDYVTGATIKVNGGL